MSTTSIYDFEVKDIKGTPVSMSAYKDKVLLIVNTASKCGFTPQYDGLEKLHKDYKERGLVVLGFPCNQFREQEPASDSEIQEFCKINFGVTFPLFSKVDVNGDDTHPLYAFLKKEKPGLLGTQKVKWNFTKFLVGSDGTVVDRYSPDAKPESLVDPIESLLGD